MSLRVSKHIQKHFFMRFACVVITLTVVLAGCSATNPPTISDGHLSAPDHSLEDTIPDPVARKPFVPPPLPAERQATYTVVVNDVPVRELLFALARDAALNVDIHPGITGNITINAVNQTLLQILNRLSEQVALKYTLDGSNLVISKDKPFFRTYDIEYVNMSRTSQSTVSVATQIATAGGSVADSGGSEAGNNSRTTLSAENSADFWTTLTENLRAILIESDNEEASDVTDSNDKEDTRVVANPVSGVITVYATQRQHKEIQLFLDRVLTNAQRQVLIEATIVEVELGDRFQSGIDWGYIQAKGAKTLTAASNMTGPNLDATIPPAFVLDFTRDSIENGITATVSLLETFGEAKVLSSPKIIALNNQTALLKVVDEKVYFTVELEEEEDSETGDVTKTFTSEIHTVPVGVIMSVTPQINRNGNVSMSIRPTITRITGYVADPAPRLQGADFDNLIPEIQVRELASLLQVHDGQTVMLGGLMQNNVEKTDNGIPYLSSLPFVGNLFNYKDHKFSKTELVIFLRPIIAGHGVISNKFDAMKRLLPTGEGATVVRLSDTTGQ